MLFLSRYIIRFLERSAYGQLENAPKMSFLFMSLCLHNQHLKSEKLLKRDFTASSLSKRRLMYLKRQNEGTRSFMLTRKLLSWD